MSFLNDVAGREIVVGIDFAGPAKANRQRRKIIAVAAARLGRKTCQVSAAGLNATLLGSPPGWTALALADAIVASELRVSVVAPDFPFSLPRALLGSDDSGHGPSSDHDAADALVAAAVAVLYREGAATGVAGDEAERVEGAIWSV